jgi:large conductance mechanosensitive channel
MLKGFKDFLMRGNVVDLAVAVVIGAAFGKIVTSLVENFINPVVAAIFGKPDLSGAMTFTLNNAKFSIGAILNELLNFVFVAAAVYLFIVLPMNKLAERRAKGEEPAAPSDEVALLTEIRDSLKAR